MARRLRTHWPALAAIGVMGAALVVLLRLSLAKTQGHLIYALDDGYIEIAIAKNFSLSGVWGVTRYSFTSATSSILFPLVLSIVYSLFGAGEATPFVINILGAVSVVIAAHLILSSLQVSSVYRFLVLVALVFLIPLPTMVFVGMEHTVHILLTLVFAYCAARLITAEEFAWRGPALGLMVLAMLLAMVRYEGLFLVAIVCALLLVRHRVVYSLTLGLVSLAPILIYGWISVRLGASWLPNSLLLKAVLPLDPPVSLSQIILEKLLSAPHLPLLMALAASLYWLGSSRSERHWDQNGLLLVMMLGASILHLILAGVGWLYRYEAYLVALGVLLNGLLIPPAYRTWARPGRRHSVGYGVMTGVASLLLVATGLVLAERGARAWHETPQATTNIYEQQYQMAKFLRDYYPGETVAANDIGAINALADIKCLDLFGLASMEVTRAKLEHRYDTRSVFQICRTSNARVAIVYDEWLEKIGGVPVEWQRVGEWWIPDNVICASPRVVFYAIEPAATDRLRNALDEFSRRLPPDVRYIKTQDQPKSDPSNDE